MARMYPKPISPDTQSHAERKLYHALDEHLTNTYIAIHSAAWIARNPRSGASDGETDFVIAHPQKGVLVVEVKGGNIRLDQKTQQWWSNQNRIKDPFKQAKDATYSLLSKFSDSDVTKHYSYPVFQAVAFPDVGLSADLRPDAPREIIIDQTRMNNLTDVLDTLFTYWQGHSEHGTKKPPGEAGIEALVNLLAPKWELRSKLAHDIEEDVDEIKELTTRQFMLLTFLQSRRRAVIMGGAGTGKTMLAIEKAARLVADGFSVALLCYNSNLAEWIREAMVEDSRVGQRPFDDEQLIVQTYHAFCAQVADWAGVPLPPGKRDDDYYNNKLPDTLLEAIDQTDRRFDAIIVDEGQDFQENWWLGLEGMLKQGKEGVFYVFMDDNQRMYNKLKDIPITEEPFHLTTNCRNTREIHEVLTPYSKARYTTNCEGCPPGQEVETVEIGDKGADDALKGVLLRLVNEEKIRPEDIVVLTPRAMENSQWDEGDRLGTLHLTWNLDTTLSNRIRVSTIKSFKGLESPVVILTELDHVPSDQELYVGLSRAKAHLIVLGELPEPQTKEDEENA
jgi:hypothetical protein